ncbi:MAG: thiamine phosphate synthase [Weeksellaceae bacterium]|nr:thiamine phosphate synthase [Weeksellaceae bacterium]
MKLKGIYLVIDPSKPTEALFKKTKLAVQAGVEIIQIWNHWDINSTLLQKKEFIANLKVVLEPFHVRLFINDDWQLALQEDLDGVHFDELPVDFDLIRTELEDKIIGITVANDLMKIREAHDLGLSYMSFCAVFPSKSVNTCEIVDFKNIEEARKITDMSIFVSGGVTPENISRLKNLQVDGVAVISGVLEADDPYSRVKEYIESLNKYKILT